MAKKKSGASTEALSKPGLDAGAIKALGERLSGPSKGEDAALEWSKSEGEVCVAMIRSALRRQDEAALDAAIDAFGGLPPEKSDANVFEPLAMAAAHASAMGFERILEMRQAEAYLGRDGDELGEWLRKGLVNSLWSDTANYSERFRNLNSGSAAKPAARCLGQDNPVALAILLSDPERLAALKAMEPTPKEGGWSAKVLSTSWGGWSSKKEAEDARKDGSGIEGSLLWNAVEAGAWRCAAMLAAIPEFSGPLAKPRGFCPGLEEAHWASRREQEVFKEAERVEFSVFDWAVVDALKAVKEGRRSDGGAEASRATAFLASVIREATQEAKDWRQEGTGMGWPEIYISRSCPQRWGDPGGNEYAQAAIQEGMDMLARFEDAGFQMPWKQLIAVFAGCPPLKEWAEMRSVSKPRADQPSRRAHSL